MGIVFVMFDSDGLWSNCKAAAASRSTNDAAVFHSYRSSVGFSSVMCRSPQCLEQSTLACDSKSKLKIAAANP